MEANRTQLNGNNKQQFYFGHIKQWKESNLSQGQYCQEQEIPLTNFKYWRNKYQEPRTPTIKDKAFTQIKIREVESPERVTTEAQQASVLVVTLPNGVKLSLPIETDPQRISHLAQSLGRALC